MPASVAIIGAGVSGLVAARALMHAGYEVTVFEASERAGGLLESDLEEGFLIERAASSFVPASHGADELAMELGVALDEVSLHARKRWIYIDGELQAVPTRASQILSSPLVSWRGKFRALTEPLQPSNPGADESIGGYCSRRLGAEVTRALIAPFVMGVFGGDADKLSLKACFPKLAELEARGGLVRGVAANKVESVLSRMQGAASAKRGRRVVAPRGGVEVLVRALADELGDRVHYNTSIASLERASAQHVLHDASGQHHHADALVLATPAAVTAALVEPYDAEMARSLLKIPYAPMCVVGVGYRKPISHPLDGFGFLVAKGESLRVLGASFESSVWPNRAPAGAVLIRCMLGGVRDPDILECSNEEIQKIVEGDLRTSLGIVESPDLCHIIRWPRAIPQYTIGHVARAKRIEAGAASLGIVLASNALWGVSVNDCIAKTNKIIKQVANRGGLALICLLALCQMMGCGASKKNASAAIFDAGATETRPAREDSDASSVEDLELAGDRGKLQIFARWLWPPSALRRSPGRNTCGTARRPALEVELMGGLQDVAVMAQSGQGPERGELFVGACQIEPRVTVVGVGQVLYVVNRDELAHEVVLEALDASGKVARDLGRMPLRVAGQRFAYHPQAAGILRLHSTKDPKDYGYVVISEGAAAVTGERGIAQLELSATPQTIELWHPPVAEGGPGLHAKLQVTVQAQRRIKKTVDLGEKETF